MFSTSHYNVDTTTTIIYLDALFLHQGIWYTSQRANHALSPSGGRHDLYFQLSAFSPTTVSSFHEVLYGINTKISWMKWRVSSEEHSMSLHYTSPSLYSIEYRVVDRWTCRLGASFNNQLGWTIDPEIMSRFRWYRASPEMYRWSIIITDTNQSGRRSNCRSTSSGIAAFPNLLDTWNKPLISSGSSLHIVHDFLNRFFEIFRTNFYSTIFRIIPLFCDTRNGSWELRLPNILMSYTRPCLIATLPILVFDRSVGRWPQVIL